MKQDRPAVRDKRNETLAKISSDIYSYNSSSSNNKNISRDNYSVSENNDGDYSGYET